MLDEGEVFSYTYIPSLRSNLYASFEANLIFIIKNNNCTHDFDMFANVSMDELSSSKMSIVYLKTLF